MKPRKVARSTGTRHAEVHDHYQEPSREQIERAAHIREEIDRKATTPMALSSMRMKPR